jgi:hypothetical protein
MSLLTSSIDLETIKPPTLEISQFPSIQIEQLANLFLQAGDTVRPILLRKISPISFQILEGHFEYHAAMKAQEIDDQFTAIRAYVVPPDLESTILAQYQFLRSLSSHSPLPIEKSTQPDLDQLETAIANRLEQKLTATIEQIVEKRINASLQSFTNQIAKQLDTHLLDIKKSLSSVPITKTVEPIIQPTDLSTESISQNTVKPKTPAKSKTKSEKTPTTAKKQNLDDDPKALQVLNDLNTMNVSDLESKLSQVKPSKRSWAKPIREQRLKQPDQKFESIADLMDKLDIIKKPTMQKVMNAW